MDIINSSDTNICEALVEANCLKFGHVQLKSQVSSNFYVDLREISMYRKPFKLLIDTIGKILNPRPQLAIVGVPYGVVPLASAVAHHCDLPYYPVRKETKDYGVKPDPSKYQNFDFVIIEDVMSTGSSIVETIDKMPGKNITDIIVIVNRNMGGTEKLETNYPHIKLHSLLEAEDILTHYTKEI